MKKNLILWIAIGVLVFASKTKAEDTDVADVKIVASGDNCGQDCHWALDSNGHIKITGSSTMTSVPWSSLMSSITSADISGVTSIAPYAFGSGNTTPLKEVTIADSVTSIGKLAFYDSNLTTVIVPDSVTNIDDGAFYTGSLKNIYYPSDLDFGSMSPNTTRILYKTVGDSAYEISGKVYSSLSMDTICPSGHQCFGCGISNEACWADFDEQTGKLSITGNGEWTKSPWNEITNSIKSVDVNGVINIPSNAFYHNGSIEEVKISDSVTSIGSGAFYNTHIKSAVVPDYVTSVGDIAFSTSYLKNIYYPSGLNLQRLSGSTHTIPYQRDGSYYRVNGKMYRNLDNMLKGIEMKRIYTVDEAEKAVTGIGNNTFSIRYR